MKKIFFVINVLLISFFAEAQTGIGTLNPNASAKLEVASSNQGFLPPRVALTATNVFSPVVGTAANATGLIVYNTNTNGTVPTNVIPGYYFWNGTVWINLIGSSTSSTLTGNGTTSTISNFSHVIVQRSSGFTLSNTDNGKIIVINSSREVEIKVPILAVGFNCMFVQGGRGEIKISASSGNSKDDDDDDVKINNRNGHNKSAGQHSIFTLVCLASGIYVSSGDMKD